MKGLCDKYCVGCKWHSRYTNSCDYIFAKGNGARGCKAGTGCSKREIGERTRADFEDECNGARTFDMTDNGKKKISTAEHEERLRLYNQGKTDRDVAEELGTSAYTIYYWRKANGLPANCASGSERHKTLIKQSRRTRLSVYEQEERMELYAKGYSDSQMAKVLGVGVTTVKEWRGRNRLEPVTKAIRKEM